MKYRVYLVSDNGHGIVQSLPDWDGIEILEFHIKHFALDTVISIEPVYERDEDK